MVALEVHNMFSPSKVALGVVRRDGMYDAVNEHPARPGIYDEDEERRAYQDAYNDAWPWWKRPR